MYKLFTILLSVFILSCNNKDADTSNRISLAILHDRTDPLELIPTSEWFNTLKPWGDYPLVDVYIEVLDHLPVHTADMILKRTTQGLFSNEVETHKGTADFKRRFKMAVQDMDSLQIHQPKSILFPVLASYLNMNVDEVHMFSDLRENSFINLYKYKTYQDLKNNQEKIIEAFQGIAIDPGATNVYIYYKPQTYEDGLYYLTLAKIYKRVLEPKGYRIHVGRRELPIHNF
ncbi:MAG: hypothetical protein ACPGSD_16395 [Flavobacteriales bacterium]